MMWAGLGDKENFSLDVSETESVPHVQYQSPMTQHQLAPTYQQFPDTQTGPTECNYFGFSEDMKYLPSESGVPASDLSDLGPGLKSDSEAWPSPGALPTQQQVFSFTSFNLPDNELSFTFL